MAAILSGVNLRGEHDHEDLETPLEDRLTEQTDSVTSIEKGDHGMENSAEQTDSVSSTEKGDHGMEICVEEIDGVCVMGAGTESDERDHVMVTNVEQTDSVCVQTRSNGTEEVMETSGDSVNLIQTAVDICVNKVCPMPSDNKTINTDPESVESVNLMPSHTECETVGCTDPQSMTCNPHIVTSSPRDVTSDHHSVTSEPHSMTHDLHSVTCDPYQCHPNKVTPDDSITSGPQIVTLQPQRKTNPIVTPEFIHTVSQCTCSEEICLECGSRDRHSIR